MHLQEAICMDQFLNLFISNLVCSPTSTHYNKMTQTCPQGVLHMQAVPSSSPKLQYQNTAILCSLLSNPLEPLASAIDSPFVTTWETELN